MHIRTRQSRLELKVSDERKRSKVRLLTGRNGESAVAPEPWYFYHPSRKDGTWDTDDTEDHELRTGDKNAAGQNKEE